MIQNKTVDNKRIARNTLFLYVQLFLTMLIGLYVSRIILDALGETDFGIYNVVGGFVALFAIISNAMTTATQRFLSFELGKGKDSKIGSVFSMAFYIHMTLAILIFLVAETLGAWFVRTQMNFPTCRVSAAIIVFHFSVFTFIVNLLCIPYNAALIAYEKMSVFALLNVTEAVLKLIVSIIILHTGFDKLIFYAFLLALGTFLIKVSYSIYVHLNFQKCRISTKIEKEYLKQMFSFVSWNLIGSSAMVLKEQGVNVLLNLFFGAAVNAARGIAYQVLHAVSGFVSSFQMAMNPQIIKLYAAGNKDEMFKLVFRGCKYSYLLMLMVSLPLLIKTHFILNVWLVKVPDYTVIFTQLVIITTLVDSLSYALITSVHASGKVKVYQIINGSFLLLVVPISYICFLFGSSPTSAMIVGLIISVICHFIRLAILNRIINFPFLSYLREVTFNVFKASIVAWIITYYLTTLFNQSVFFDILAIILSLFISAISCFYIGLNIQDRKVLISIVMNFLKKQRR